MSAVTTTVDISGMTCGHCVTSVTEELEALEDVSSVTVERNEGGISRATVVSASELPRHSSPRRWRRPATSSSPAARSASLSAKDRP